VSARVEFRHVLLTRFNTRLTDGGAGPDDAWLADRLRLFETYCVPSVRRQTSRNFTWLVFFDAATPARWRSRFEALAGSAGFRPVFLDRPFDGGQASRAITRLGLDDAPFLITSRLDNDDALAPHFVAAVQRAVRPRELEFLNFPLGYQLAGGRVYLRPYLAGSFASLVERRADGPWRTVHFVQHHLIGRHPVRQLRSRPAWLQVVHGTNLANEVRGIPVRGAAAARLFGLEGLDPEVPPARERAAAAARFVVRGLSTADARARAGSVLRRRSAPAAGPPDRAPRPVPLVTAILTCHDRRELTLRALAGWFGQRGHGAELSAVLVDDGSTDGTAAAVAAAFPQVTVIPGGGSLYWAAGMALAERHARGNDPDALVWLNDDVVLAENCLRELMSTSAGSTPPAVVAGALADPDTGAVSYGAFAPRRWHPLRGSLVEPAGRPLPVRAIHGNVVYVPRAAYARLGIDGGFAHAYADLDYGLRLNRAGHPVLLTAGTVGWCSRGTSSRPSSTGPGPLLDRLARLNSPRGVPMRSQVRFLRRHGGPLWPVLAVAPYAREILGHTQPRTVVDDQRTTP
jgi:GT2 family glycosyltransferase